MTEKEKALAGLIYQYGDEELCRLRKKAHRLCLEYNKLEEDNPRRKEIIDELIPNNNNAYLQGPIQIDYGCFTRFGKNCYANFNLVILDSAMVEIGDNVFIGPNVSIVTPIHPLLSKERNSYQREDGTITTIEYSKGVKIHSNCWIASNVTICGGVHIGEGSVIGAGSVVTRDIAPHSFAAGNPCNVIRKIDENDSVYLKKELWTK